VPALTVTPGPLPKFHELSAVAEATCRDICIVESWLSDEISDNELAIDKCSNSSFE